MSRGLPLCRYLEKILRENRTETYANTPNRQHAYLEKILRENRTETFLPGFSPLRVHLEKILRENRTETFKSVDMKKNISLREYITRESY